MSNHVIHVAIHVIIHGHWSSKVEGIFNKVGWEGVAGLKSAFKAFDGTLCCRPKAKGVYKL
jgi:hypothetical protein